MNVSFIRLTFPLSGRRESHRCHCSSSQWCRIKDYFRAHSAREPQMNTYVSYLSFLPGTALKRFLLYARRSEIRGVDIDNPYINIITALTVPDIDDVTVVDYDALEERIYWADVKTQTIKRAFINGTSMETVISGGTGQQTFCRGWLVLGPYQQNRYENSFIFLLCCISGRFQLIAGLGHCSFFWSAGIWYSRLI